MWLGFNYSKNNFIRKIDENKIKYYFTINKDFDQNKVINNKSIDSILSWPNY